jgi:hypothetical protein
MAYGGIQFETHFNEHHYIKYNCITDDGYFGELHPTTKVFYVFRGRINRPEIEWPTLQLFFLPPSWTYQGELPCRIYISHQESGYQYVFEISYEHTEWLPEIVGKAFGNVHIISDIINL